MLTLLLKLLLNFFAFAIGKYGPEVGMENPFGHHFDRVANVTPLANLDNECVSLYE